MKKFVKFITCLLSIMLLITASVTLAADGSSSTKESKAQQNIDTLKYDVYRGKIIDAKTNAPLIFATIAVKGINVATVSNSDGEFLLKIDKNQSAEKLLISHIGYKNLETLISTLKPKKNLLALEIDLVPLTEVTIYPHDPIFLVRNMLKKVTENYSVQPNMMKGFYRETIKKNRNYVAISEAVVDIHKASYSNDLRNDQVQIYKGRKSTDVKKMDTLLFKLQGGPHTSLLLDVIKNPYILLSEDFLDNYSYELTNITKINDKLHYVIEFKQKRDVDYPLYYGLLYIETQNLALASAKFSLSLDDKDEAAKFFIRKKPAGVKLIPTSVDYIVNYREQNGKWFFNYARGEVNFKCNWKRRLFNTNYTAMSEIAVTNRQEENIIRFKARDRFKSSDIFEEQVANFDNDDFWGANNTIEPDQSIESAIRKLKRRSK